MTITRERQPNYPEWEAGGAVTHVFVQDSLKGYGILIENMLEHRDQAGQE